MPTITESNWTNSLNPLNLQWSRTPKRSNPLLLYSRFNSCLVVMSELNPKCPEFFKARCFFESLPTQQLSHRHVVFQRGWGRKMGLLHYLLGQLSEDKMIRCQCTRKCFQTISFFIYYKESQTALTDGRGEFSWGTCPAASLPLSQWLPKNARQVEMLVECSSEECGWSQMHLHPSLTSTKPQSSHFLKPG